MQIKQAINPFEFTKFDRTREELEAMLLFSIMVAGKRADLTYKKFDAMMHHGLRNMEPNMSTDQPYSPFEIVQGAVKEGKLYSLLRKIRIGQYARINKAFKQIVKLDPKTCSLGELEQVHGIGPKTARMYLLHSRPNQKYAVLDTHVLAFLRARRIKNVPKITPHAGPIYERLEQAFLRICEKDGIDPANLDQQVWRDRTISKFV